MKFINWKFLIKTCTVCLLPILLGVILWDKLPETIAIHFDINNTPDNFSSKGFAVFALPFLMMLFQIVCCISTDINSHKYGNHKKVEDITKWIIPILSIILQSTILGYSVGLPLDIRRIAMIIVSVIFIITGSCLSKLDYIKKHKLNPEKARKINRFIGFETVLMGIFGIITVFFPPIVSAVWLILFIPYIIASAIYSIVTAKK